GAGGGRRDARRALAADARADRDGPHQRGAAPHLGQQEPSRAHPRHLASGPDREAAPPAHRRDQRAHRVASRARADRRACASSHAIECQVAWHSQRSGHPASSRALAIAYARASEPRASLLTARARRARASDDVVRWAWKSSRATTAVMARRWALVARRVSEVG